MVVLIPPDVSPREVLRGQVGCLVLGALTLLIADVDALSIRAVALGVLVGLGVWRGGATRDVALATAAMAIFALSAVLSPHLDGPGIPSAARLGELLLPDLLRPLPADARGADVLAAMTAGAGTPARLYPGLAPTLLALLGAACAGGVPAWIARGVTVACVALVVGAAGPLEVGALSAALAGAQVGLLVLAGLGLTWLHRRDDAERTGPALTLGSVTVLLGGAVIGASLYAGSVDARELAGLLEARWVPDGPPLDAASREAVTTHVVDVLDRAALAAAGTMVGLLLYLRDRSRLMLALVTAIALLDVASVLPEVT